MDLPEQEVDPNSEVNRDLPVVDICFPDDPISTTVSELAQLNPFRYDLNILNKC